MLSQLMARLTRIQLFLWVAMIGATTPALAGLPQSLLDQIITVQTEAGVQRSLPRGLFEVAASDQTLEAGVRVTWTAAPGLDAYFRVLRDGALLSELSSQDSVYVDTSALPLRTYHYQVQLWDLESGYLVDIGLDPGTRGFFRPRDGDGSQYTDLDGVRLTWQDRSSIEDGFIVYRDGVAIDTVNTNVTSYFDDGATPLYPHSYCVAAMIADGTEVSELGSYGLGGTDIVAAGNIATVATGGHVYVLDVPDPGAVSVAAQFPTTPGPTRLASNWPLVNGVDGAGRVYMFFVGDGTNASFLGSATTPGTAEDLAMFDKWGFIADGGAGLSVYAMEEFPDFRDQISIAGFAKSVAFRHEAPYVGGYAYVATTGATHEITTVFVPNPETPGTSSVLGSVSLPGSPEDVAISGDYLFVASRTGGVHVLDISIPSAPSLVTTIGSPDITDARRISIEGSRAYVADGSDGLAVLELGRLGHPQIAASFSGGQGNGVAVAGDRAYFLRDSDLALLQLPVDITSDVDCTVGIRGTIEPPTDISATYGHYLDRIVISWADNSSDETGFRIKQAGGGPIIDVGPNVTSYEDTSVSQYTEYTYEVYVLDGNGNEVFGGSVIGIAGPGTMHGPIYATASQGTYEDRIELIWEDAPDEEFYSIVRESDTEPPVEIATVPANTTTYDDPVPEGDKDYYYSIIAKSNHGGSSTPDEGSQPLGMMENVFPPDNLVATDGDFEDHVHLSWENRSAKAVYFRISRDGVPIQTVTGTATSADDYGVELPLLPGQTYTYQVESVTADGTASASYDSGHRTLLPPSDVSAEDGVAENRILVTWGDESLVETGYRIYRKIEGYPPPGTEIGTRGPGATSFLDDTAIPGVVYDYTVAAFDGVGESELVTDQGVRYLVPPTDVAATDDEYEDQIVVTWGDASGAEDGYRIRRDGVLVGTVGADTTEFVDTGITFGAQHDYLVVAFDSYGESVGVNDAGSTRLLTPGSVNASDLSPFKIIVTWTDESEVNTGYEVRIDGVSVANLGANATSYTDTSLPADGVEHDFCVRATGTQGAVSLDGCDTGARVPFTTEGGSAGWVTDLSASDGTYDNRVRLEWTDASTQEDRFEIYRDGIFLDSVAPNIETYSDTDVVPGQIYRYEVVAIDDSTPGSRGFDYDIGWTPPDGAITGRVTTRSGAPVDGVTVTLDPAPNRSISFDGELGVGYRYTAAKAPTNQFTVEFWMKSSDTSKDGAVFSYTKQTYFDELLIRTHAGTNEVGVSIRDFEAQLAAGNLYDGEWHHVAVTSRNNSEPTRLYVDGVQTAQSNNWQTGTLASDGGMAIGRALVGQFTFDTYNKNYRGLLDEMRVWNVVRTPAQIQASMNATLSGDEANLIAYYDMDAASSVGLADLSGHGNELTFGRGIDEPVGAGVFPSEDGAPVVTNTVSDLQGNYALSGLYYGDGSTFQVIPSAPNKTFDPVFKSISLDPQSPVQNEVGFNDVTAVSLSGVVSLQGTTCTQQGVEIYVDGTFAGATKSDGRYTVAVQPGDHVIEPRLGTAVFSPASYQVSALTNQASLNFLNTTTHLLSGALGGSCGANVGTLHFAVATEDACFQTAIDGTTDYDLALPAQTYVVTFVGVDNVPAPLSEADVVTFFTNLGSRTVDLSDGDVTLDLLYRAPLTMTISGFPSECPGFTDPETGEVTAPAPVLTQLESYDLTISVYEDYGSVQCPVDSGLVTIYDEIMDVAGTPTTIEIKDGRASYTTTANLPNIYPGRVDAQGNNRSFQKPITFAAEVPGQPLISKTKWALVAGDRPRTGTFVSATSEEVPLLILRDPPGDGSSAFLEKGETYTYTLGTSALIEQSSGTEVAVEAGFEFEAGTLFFSTDSDVDVTTSLGFEIGARATAAGEVEFSVTTTKEFRTSDDEVFVGPDADLILGVAMNLIFAKTDVIGVDGCTIQRSQKIRFGADGDEPFDSIYLYTTSHIKNVVIPQLEELAELVPADSSLYLSYAANWQDHLDLNDELRTEALENVEENRSFSAGAGFGYSHESTSSQSFAWEIALFSHDEESTEIGFELAGAGVTTTFSTSMTFEAAFGGSVGSEHVTTTGYELGDNDPGDFFSVDIASDPVYGTPVFRTVSGRSACPLEPNTQPRDQIELAIEPPILSGVPLTEPAEFTLSLTNTSESDEAREYQLRSIQASNTGGAIIRVNGSLLDQGLSFFLDAGQTQQATLTVDPGPSRFYYDDLAVQVVAPCEYELWEAGGTLAVSDTVQFSVAFDSPCSDITLVQPTSGWVYNVASSAASGDTLSLLLDNFQLAISETDSINSVGAQYRKLGTESWITIGEIDRNAVPVYPTGHAQEGEPRSVSIDWAIPGTLADGQYELRAFTRCDAGLGVSLPATGRLDRTAPVAFGAPQPADSVLALGDQISITFAEPIACSSVSGTTVGLEVVDPGGNQAVQINTTCNGSSIVITPVNPPLSLLEGQTLHATVNAIKDLAGNPMESSVQWQFDVRRSDFTWASSSVYREQTYLGSGSVLATLVNGSTGDLQFDLTGVPSWLTPTQSTGTVVAGQTLGIGFAIDPTLPVGSYQGTITAEVPNTAIAAQLDVRVDIVCQPPSWTVDPSDFSQSMTAVLELSIGGTVSTDPDDIVFGFVGDEIRGVAQPILVDTISPPRYLAFMNIYSDALAGENVRFKIYDSDQCKLYQAADNYLYFEADRRKGTPEVPITLVALDAPSVSQQEIDLNAGWTWFSLNLADSLDMSVVTVLGDLNPEAGDLIKSRTAFAQYDAELGWQGSLTDLDVRESYAISLSTAGTILHEGQPVAADTPIYLVDGWNWVGYPPSASQAINDALVNLMPSDGDVMKSQSAFAEHVASVPVWVGGLDTLVPGGGYKLYLEDAVGAGAWLQYADPQPFAGAGAFATVAGEAFGRPSGSTTNGTGGTAGAIVVPTSQGLGGDRTGAIGSASANRPNWHLDVGRQFNMTVIARVQVDGSAEGKTPGVLGAFVGDELRGYVESQYIAPLDEYYAFLVIDSDVADGETVTFRYFDEANDAVGDVVETVSFRADDALGTLHEPLVLHAERGLGQSGVPAVFQLAAPYPNPIRTDVGSTVRWDMPRSAHVAVQVFDVSGKLVETVADEAMPAGSHSRPLSTRELSSGIYFLRMQTPGYVKTHKIMVVR